jgi:hypothetical protein
MLLTLTAEQFNVQFVHFLPPIKNNILTGSVFSRIIYSPPYFAMQGVYVYIHMSDKLGSIEQAILGAYASSKPKIMSLNKCVKTTSLILKISGVWETDDACGLAYKFIQE